MRTNENEAKTDAGQDHEVWSGARVGWRATRLVHEEGAREEKLEDADADLGLVAQRADVDERGGARMRAVEGVDDLDVPAAAPGSEP
jgi:hypothetical protein